MKKKLLYTASLLLFVASFHGCENLETCKHCSLNTYSAGGDLLTSVKGAEYCDAKLITIEATPEYTDPVTGSVTRWVCD